MNQQRLAVRINALARLKAQQQMLAAKAEELIAVIKKNGGGESARWRAELITMPKRVMVVPKHKQLRLYAKG